MSSNEEYSVNKRVNRGQSNHKVPHSFVDYLMLQVLEFWWLKKGNFSIYFYYLKIYLLDKEDPGEVEADEDGETEDHGTGGHQVPKPAKERWEMAKHSQQHYSTVLGEEWQVTLM